MRIFYLLLLALLYPMCALTQVTDYLDNIRANGKTTATPEYLWTQTRVAELAKQLQPYAADTITDVSDEAYYIVFMAGYISKKTEDRQTAVSFLAEGLNSSSTRIVSNNITRLQHFTKADIDAKAKQVIEERLDKWNSMYYMRVAKMAAQLGVGRNQIRDRQMLEKGADVETKWALHLAMARLGEQTDIDFITRRAYSIPYDYAEDLIRTIIPELIYTRQKQAIDVCVGILQDDDCKCASGNPDVDAKILCGYRIMELLAPVIKGYPYKSSASGMIDASNYEEALSVVRKWFADNTEYEIIE